MHAGKIRTANIPAFQLSPRDVVFFVCVSTLAAYMIGFLMGMAF